jgi:hypothetical protein
VFEEKPVIACYAKGVQVTKQSSVPNQIKGFHDPNSYRKITITNLIGKVIEKIHLTRNSNAITEQQNKLQKGFTQGEMPIIAHHILDVLRRYVFRPVISRSSRI